MMGGEAGLLQSRHGIFLRNLFEEPFAEFLAELSPADRRTITSTEGPHALR